MDLSTNLCIHILLHQLYYQEKEIYDYNKSKFGDLAKKFFGEYGYLHTDCYAGYNKLTRVTQCNCMAHYLLFYVILIYQINLAKIKQI